MTTWDLMPAMSFLIPHIEHGGTRGSMTFSHNSGPSTSSSGSSSNSLNFLVSSSPSSLDSVCEEISIQHDAEINTCSSSPVIIVSDDLNNTFLDITNTDSDKKKQLNENDEKNAGFPSKKYKAVVPSSRTFSQQKKNKENNLELLIAKSSSAIQSIAACLTQDTLDETNKEKKMHPFVAIEAAFEKIPTEMEMECFIAIMNVISKYKK